jgi:hypothetical protein
MRVELKVDGQAVPLNDFTQEIIGNVAAALAESLRGVDEGWQQIELSVRA